MWTSPCFRVAAPKVRHRKLAGGKANAAAPGSPALSLVCPAGAPEETPKPHPRNSPLPPQDIPPVKTLTGTARSCPRPIRRGRTLSELRGVSEPATPGSADHCAAAGRVFCRRGEVCPGTEDLIGGENRTADKRMPGSLFIICADDPRSCKEHNFPLGGSRAKAQSVCQ
jgi:hypothetical protein